MNSITTTSFLADSVEMVQGKLYALGIGWNLVGASALPVQQSRIGLGILVNVPYSTTNMDHKLELTLQDEDGTPMPLCFTTSADGSQIADYKFTAQFNLGRPPALPAGDAQIVPLAINFDGLVFHKACMYRWVIEIDGKVAGENSMRVVRA